MTPDKPMTVSDTPIQPDLIENLIDAVRQDEAQCHFGTAGSRARARTDLQDATKDIREAAATLQAQLERVTGLLTRAMYELEDSERAYRRKFASEIREALAAPQEGV